MAVKKGVDGAVKKQNIDIASFRMAPGEVWRLGSGVPVGRVVGICVEIVYPQKRLLCGLFIAVFCIFAAYGSRGRYWMCRSRRKEKDRAARIAVT